MKVGIDSVLRGMAGSTIPNFHSGLSEDYRSAWISYSLPGEGFGFDLAAWTIMQERERGLPPFNEYFRRYPGQVTVPIRERFEDFTSDPEMLAELKRLYRSPEDVDLTVGQQLDEQYFPGTTVPRSALITSLFSLFGVGTSDRFCVGYSALHCFLVGKPWDCTPLNALDDILWEPFPNPIFPRARLASFWFEEIDIANNGEYALWNLITKNSDVKCLQLVSLSYSILFLSFSLSLSLSFLLP
jgi:peroxidase